MTDRKTKCCIINIHVAQLMYSNESQMESEIELLECSKFINGIWGKESSCACGTYF